MVPADQECEERPCRAPGFLWVNGSEWLWVSPSHRRPAVPWNCYLLGTFGGAPMLRQVSLNSPAPNASFQPKMCDGNSRKLWKRRDPRRQDAGFVSTFLDSVTLAVRPGICFISLDGQAFGLPCSGLWPPCLTGTVWKGKCVGEAAKAWVYVWGGEGGKWGLKVVGSSPTKGPGLRLLGLKPAEEGREA